MIFNPKVALAMNNYATARKLLQNPVLANNPYFKDLVQDRAQQVAATLKEEGITPAEFVDDPTGILPIAAAYYHPTLRVFSAN